MTIKRFLFCPILAAIVFLTSSCGSSNKFQSMVYLADSVKESQKVVSNFEYLLQPGDRIQILVTALNLEAVQAFNIAPLVTTLGKYGEPATSDIASSGYFIEQDGTIQFPQIGKITVKGMTTNAVAKMIQSKLLEFLKEPVVLVNISNFKVNVVGEVNRPGSISVPNGKITILEAISQSGDLTLYGRRENILVIREKNGKRAFGQLNLSSNSIFESPYYFLEQGDVVYVEMKKDKLLLNDATEARNFRIASLLLTAVSAIGIILNAIK